MRIFISIDIPEKITVALGTIQEQIKKQNILHGAYTKPENMHITLAFLGETPKEHIDALIAALQTIKQEPFLLQISSLEVDSWQHPSVVWVPVISPELERLSYKITQVVYHTPIHTIFKGHITLARIKILYYKRELKKILSTLCDKSLSWKATEFKLKQSTITSEGAYYTTLYTFSLEA